MERESADRSRQRPENGTGSTPVGDQGRRGPESGTGSTPVGDRGRQGPESGTKTTSVWVLGRRTPLEVCGPRARRIAAIAAAQRGRVARDQLFAAGIGRSAIGRLLARGAIFREHPGVYAVGHLASVELGDETGALLAIANRAGLSHYSAAMLWNLLPASAGDGLIHVVAFGQSRKALAGVRVHGSRTVSPADIQIHRGLPVTSPAWTLLDLAELLAQRELELAFDRALVSRIMRTQEVTDVLERADGRAGRRPLRRLLDRERGPTVTRSQAEERFLALIRGAHLPEPQVNARIHGYEVDFLWPRRLIVEIDGFRFHSTRRAFEHDHRKDAVLRGAGLPVLRFTWDQLDRAPLQVIAAVARELALPDRRR